jgi:hypothetical protein
MDTSRGETKHERSEAAASPTYEAPALTIIGPMSEFTFGSKQNGNDGINTRKNAPGGG